MSNLDRDIREAARLGYGCHYGNYMADKMAGRIPTQAAPDEDDGPPAEVRRCKECGGVFVPHRHNQLFCSEPCRSVYHSRQAQDRYRGKKSAEEKEESKC